MAGEISRQEQALTRGAQMVAQARQELNKQMSDLEAELADLKTAWAGAGASAFQQVRDQWDTATKIVISELDVVEGKLRQTETNYRAADEASAGGFTRTARAHKLDL